MKVKVRAFGDLTRLIGSESLVDLRDDEGLEDLISKLAEKANTTKKGCIGPYEVEADLIVLINGRNMHTLKEPLSLNDGDVVAVLSPFVGG